MSYIIDHQLPSGLRTQETRQAHGSYAFADAEPLLSSHCVVDMREDDNSIYLAIDMPGVLGKDIGVSIQKGVLSIRGFRCLKDVDGRVVKRQRLCRRFSVDTGIVDVSRAAANVWNGVLNLHAPKKNKPPTVKLPVTEIPTCVFSSKIHRGRSGTGPDSRSEGPFRIPDDEQCAVH
mmetsp:Transcript_106443/g.159211  ORF Transcript_106443/g.159211 Transcript_106443/m.159211 type:complete len:176 (+) Transcript_106443:168-695(+)|eukprot:CAMPEP_0117029838 /NCGR_PEP_ID=MMETSP0472-20121206/21563_1 /TAXON_ID=693140 ORGANISM="Tiarina fusus, Strain LIS" /NCGR_SAMPLE_ID=MMETSP0472 /ASSEMBLY_ACC=CAM_ASM_000603 /LENGTH=175 /DNA_ID=CAMNT_0004737697 /DNA_START=192 /DNA_END=719 /DNA_ORIENTATION=-